MKSIIIIYCCVLLLTIVSNGVGKETLREILNSMAKKNKNISGIFEPSKDGFLGQNFFGVFYKGMFLPKKMTVAMKFLNLNGDGKKEYEMYTYLGAINNPNVEANGILAIYYYGKWKDYHIMAMTLLDREFYKRNRDENFNEIDLLILFREYVRITKYMHVSGVFIKEIRLIDIWFRKNQGFIYDFTWGKRLSNDTTLNRLRAARRDWEEFFRSMYHFIAYRPECWSWLGFSYENIADKNRMNNETIFVISLGADSKSNESHIYSGLRKVFSEFAKYAFSKDTTPPPTPFYDQMYQVIVEELERYAQQQQKPPIPSWISDDQDKRDASAAIDKIPKISAIRDPFESEHIEYDKVKFKFFRILYHTQPSSSGTSERPDLGKESCKFFDD